LAALFTKDAVLVDDTGPIYGRDAIEKHYKDLFQNVHFSNNHTTYDKPLVVENEAEPGLKWTALGKASNSFYRSAGKDYKFEGTSGESHKFAFKGGGEK